MIESVRIVNFQHLEYFNELAKTQYMAQAAQNLGISQPTLSYAVKKLEEELGVPLFEKSGRNIRLTVYGKSFAEYTQVGVKKILEGERRVMEMAEGSTGKVAIGVAHIVSPSFMPDVIREFRQVNPSSKVDFELQRGLTSELLTKVQDGDLDLALVTKTSKRRISDLELLPLMERHLELVVPAGHELANAGPVSLRILSKYPFISFSRGNALFNFLQRIFDEHHVQVHQTSVSDDIETMMGLVAIGEGVALLPKSKYHEAPGVVNVPVEEDTSYTLCLVSKEGQQPKAVESMADFLQKFCRDHDLLS